MNEPAKDLDLNEIIQITQVIRQKLKDGKLTMEQLKWWLDWNFTTRQHLLENYNIKILPCREEDNGEWVPIEEE